MSSAGSPNPPAHTTQSGNSHSIRYPDLHGGPGGIVGGCKEHTCHDCIVSNGVGFVDVTYQNKFYLANRRNEHKPNLTSESQPNQPGIAQRLLSRRRIATHSSTGTLHTHRQRTKSVTDDLDGCASFPCCSLSARTTKTCA